MPLYYTLVSLHVSPLLLQRWRSDGLSWRRSGFIGQSEAALGGDRVSVLVS